MIVYRKLAIYVELVQAKIWQSMGFIDDFELFFLNFCFNLKSFSSVSSYLKIFSYFILGFEKLYPALYVKPL